MYGSGVEIPDDAATILEQLWSVDASVYRSPEELPLSRGFIEGGVARVEVNRYERDPQAREACLHHWGYRCSVCGLSMEELYGGIGHEFIHVHHLVELSSVGSDYHVDPIADLRPVCPNCHSMLHARRPAFITEELRQRVSRSGSSLALTLNRYLLDPELPIASSGRFHIMEPLGDELLGREVVEQQSPLHGVLEVVIVGFVARSACGDDEIGIVTPVMTYGE
jgi:hypothetical protein